jgi:2-methylcitrate dehydratase PrpD
MTAAREDATTRLVRHALDLDLATAPEAVSRQARIVLADTLGVLAAASTRPAVRTALRATEPDTGACTVVGHARRAPAAVAAFVNGIGGHDVELDDLHAASRTHPASVVVPAAIAAAELRSGCRYQDLLAGIVAAYDVQTRLSIALGPIAQYDRGFHPSAVTGAVGAAVAAGRVLGLAADAMRTCIGLAASQSSGLLTYYDDPFHMAKSFQTGIAARNGVTAALFARAGYSAPPDVLTGRNTMLPAFGRTPAEPGGLVADLGARFEITRTTLKRHASCALTHAAVDALLTVLRDAAIAAGDIRRIEVRLPHAATAGVDGNTLWTHNIQYVVALAAFERRVSIEHFTPVWTADPDVRALAARVAVAGSDELQARFPARSGAIVRVVTDDVTIDGRRDAPRGSPDDPLTENEVREKFEGLTATVFPAPAAARLWETVRTAPLDAPAEEILQLVASGAAASAGARR